MRYRLYTGLCAAALAVTCLATIRTASAAPAAPPPPRPDHRRPGPIPKLPGLVILFNGKKSQIQQNFIQRGSHAPAAFLFHKGTMIPNGGDIITKQLFTNFHLHVEFREPYEPNNHGQDRGNSGIAPYGLYEIQVLDSYGIASPGSGDCGAVYGEFAPLFNACKPPLQWQTYDIIFRSPRWDATGKKTEDARVTVILNGIVVQNNTIIPTPTGIAYGRTEHPGPGPILFQNHGHPVEFRDIWLQPLPDRGANHY